MLKKTMLVASAGATLALGQVHTQEHVVIERGAVQMADKIGIAGSFAQAEFGGGGPVVKNAPYQAEAITETIQVLADGNRITRRNAATVARDSEGRTRRDIAVAGLNAKISVIHDPVANVSYTLEHETKIARKMKGRGVMIHVESRGPEGDVRTQRMPADVIMTRPHAAAPVEAMGDLMLEGAPRTFNLRIVGPDNAKTESLGKRTIDGVVAEGTRVTNVIPAGEIGNERPIEIVFERWYSPELQALISSSHQDPMMGETTYKLEKLSRNEPLKSLFEVPADYTVKDEGEPGVRFFRRRSEKE